MPAQTTTVKLTDQSPADVKADALVLATVSTANGAALAGPNLGRKSAGHVATMIEALGVKGRAGEVVVLGPVPGVTAPVVVLAGLGEVVGEKATATSAAGKRAHRSGLSAYTPESVRRGFGMAIRRVGAKASVAVAAPVEDAELVGAVAEGAAFAAYDYAKQTGKEKGDRSRTGTVLVVTPLGKDKRVKAAVTRTNVLAANLDYARDLVNTPPNQLYPETFADSVRKRAAGTKVKVDVMDEKALAKAGCGGILGVGQGSARPPRIVTMTYKPAKAKTTLAYIGKGITFDSGGLCLKPGGSMVTMKCDMAGAAAVAAAVLTIAELGLPIAVTGYLCLAENMTGSSAQRPGDVVTMHDGRTVEIINTDAEGRLVMGDGLALAADTRPDAIVDIATLTGAAVRALGNRTAALIGNDDDFEADVKRAADAAGESFWQIPITEETRAGMDSHVADIKHTGDAVGGMMVAAAFLREFIPDGDGQEGATPWAHLDIAGPAFNEKDAFGYTPRGGTGFGTGTLVRLAEERAGH
ncbi:MAG TPA: leucyl aminopeptidase [Segeticoccus sp.]|uniref:leucyl aminopeptidase n=1 Tax=Segeticoccus sp. TaxID=2706531 RepID=UPI002D7F1D23|nr:leucyl aminopeptidase [Segeticoccus sp.]HET8600368.1 leucyl aminopeptidase [Segeticoccus sp.]